MRNTVTLVRDKGLWKKDTDIWRKLHCEPKKHTKIFLSYLPQNPVDSDKILYLLSWIYLPQSFINGFHLT